MPRQKKKKGSQAASTAAEGGPPEEPQASGPQQPQTPASQATGGGEEAKAKGKGKKGKGGAKGFEEPAGPPSKPHQERKYPSTSGAGDVPTAEVPKAELPRDDGTRRKKSGKESTPPGEVQRGPPPGTGPPPTAPGVPAWGPPRGPTPVRYDSPPPGFPVPTVPMAQGSMQRPMGPPGPQVRPPGPQVRPPGPQVRPPGPQVRPPGPQARPPGPQVGPPGPQIPPPTSQNIPVEAPPTDVIRTQRDDAAFRQAQAASTRAFKIPVRKDLNQAGTKGIKTVVETNHLALDLSRLRTKEAIHYDVSLEPDKPKKMLRFAVEEFRKKHYPDRYPAFDGRKNLIAAKLLPFQQAISDTVNVFDEERQKNMEFTVKIQFVARVDLSQLQQYMRAGSSLQGPQTAIQMIDIVLRSAPSLKFVPVGRSYFTPPAGQIVKLGDGMEMWLGLYQSVNLGWRPFVNVDVVHKAFPTNQNVLDVIYDVCSFDEVNLQRPLDSRQAEALRKFLRGLKIDYMIPNQPQTKRTYKVNDVVKSASELTFKQENGSPIKVSDYFASVKRVPLRFPHLPCLHVGSLQRPNPIYLPLEFCTVTKGQAVQRQMNERQTSELIKRAATSTTDRKKKIEDALKKVNFNSDPAVREFGLTVNESFSKVPARILPPPELAYRNEKSVRPAKGVWRAVEFLQSQSLEKWAILNLDRRTREDNLRNIHKCWVDAGRQLGMNIEAPMIFKTLQTPSKFDNRAKQELKSFFIEQKGKLQLIVVVVPDRGDTYSIVKQLAELSVGVLTQCVKATTVYRMNFSTAANLLLKVNSKLNGVNHQISRNVRPHCLLTPAMIVGADVTHPSPQQVNIPSVAAVCASHDPNGFRYNIQFRLQPPRTEIIQDLEAIMKHHLIYFYQKTRQKPHRILFFRDGVSEGEFQKILNAELTAIRRACTSLTPDYKPSITFLVVQKRHHTRFFPTRREDEDGRNRNVPAGTIVDTEITHPTEIDFYLVSHASIQGVSRPTKYHCLWDDSKMTDDDLQQLTYFLCHMFSRCTRSVSYPAPTYYAHLAAYRARVYLEGREIQLNSLENEQRLNTIEKDFILNSPMFFV